MPAIIRIGDPISCGDTMGQGSGNVFANGIPVSRKGTDLTAGHCFNPVPIVAASHNVFTNYIPTNRVGDPIAVHCCGDSCHSGNASNGSPDVFINDPGGGPQSVSVIVERYIQPGVDKLLASQILADDPDAAPTFVEYRRQQESRAGLVPSEPKFVEESKTQVPPPVTLPTDCSDIEAHQGPFSESFLLSPNFTLGMLTTKTLVSNYPLRANAGLTEKQICCNLRILCVNVLEPMLAKYGKLTINSAFRYDQRSQHGKGQAVDVSFSNLRTEADYWARATDIKDSFAYDQYIYEAERTVWYHLSFSSERLRRMTLTKPRGTNTMYAGIQRIIS